jgi:hypothetical protein
MIGSPSGHLDDLLSGYVDGELGGEDRAAVDAHLASCTECRAELQATREAKTWITTLPPVGPPFGFYERMLRGDAGPTEPRSRWVTRLGAVSLAATASIWFGIVGFASLDAGRPGGMPPLGSLFNLHSDAKPVPNPTTPPEPLEHRAAALGLPSALAGGYELTEVLDRRDSTQAVYQSGPDVISVILAPGVINVDGLSSGTTIEQVGNQIVFRVPWDGQKVLVAQRGAFVVIMMGPAPLAPAMTDQVDPPTPGRSISDRIEAAGRGLFQAFGLG